MFNHIFIIFLLIVAFVLSELLDVVGRFSLYKSHNEIGEYNFEYKLENGELFHGKTIALNGCDTNVHIMFGAGDSIYWVQFDDDDFRCSLVFDKAVRQVERINNGIHFKDDLIEFTLTNSNGRWNEDSLLEKVPYLTLWDFENICLKKVNNDRRTFHFEIRSKNNPRIYKGITSWEDEKPRFQKIHLKDVQYDAKYEIGLTENELNSNVTFCKGISKTIFETAILGACAVEANNTKLMKELMGSTETKLAKRMN